jgi:two-component system phosphate regulon sensor histidine kinase PhoR
MLSFRKKIFFSDLALFFIFLIVLYPIVPFKFLIFCALILFFYSSITWFMTHLFSRPIQKILDAIPLYQNKEVEFLPRISMSQLGDSNEFIRLAITLNSLSEKIENQIAHLVDQRKETEGILQSLAEGVIALDKEAKITFANQVSCQMLGVFHDQMIGRQLHQISVQEDLLLKKCHELVLQTLQTFESTTETWILNKENPLFFHLSSTPLPNQSGAILVIQDKTSDYKMVQMGKDFIANASHELKTPITIIRGFAETLQDISLMSPKMVKEVTEKIIRTCERLTHLVKSLLVLADVENMSDNRFRKVDLVPLVENCTHMFLTAHPKIRFSIENKLSQSLVAADSDLLDLAIMNLLENSVKYSNVPAQIEVFLEQENSQVSLTVADKGIGIPERDLPHIFDRFYTVDKARSRKFGGAGLGLSIVKTVVEKHRGSLKVTSEVGKGSTFTLSFPVCV